MARLAYLFNGIMKADSLDAAWDWISFWGETDPSIAFLEETGYFPASTVIAKDPRITGNPLYQAAAETIGFGSLPPAFVGMAAVAPIGVVKAASARCTARAAAVRSPAPR